MAFWNEEVKRLNGFSGYGAADPKVVAANVPPSAKAPTIISLPPSTKAKTEALLVKTAQAIKKSESVTAKVQQDVAKVKASTGKLKGFFGFGAADISKKEKVKVTQENKFVANQAASQANINVAELRRTKQELAVQKYELLKDKAQIANENAKLKRGIAEKKQQKTSLDSKIKTGV